ncbi:hypothetical protein Tco_1228258 [Tanacetum coccineum]
MDDPNIIMEEYIDLETEKTHRRGQEFNWETATYGKREHEEMEIFIKEFRTTNEILLKEKSNLLSKLKIEVSELSKVVGNVLVPKNKVKGETTRRGRMTSEATPSKEDKDLMLLNSMFNDDEPCGHHSAKVTTRKVYQSGFYWLSVSKDANDYDHRERINDEYVENLQSGDLEVLDLETSRRLVQHKSCNKLNKDNLPA